MKPHLFRAGSTYYRDAVGITDAQLEQFRAERGLKLPDEYVELLRHRNGGFLRYELHVDEQGKEHKLAALPGIGDEETSHDLLEVVSFTDEEGRDISRSIVALRYEPYAYTALDYRECGPEGEPAVVNIDILEPPTIIRKIADTFGQFIAGLQRGDDEFILGFRDVDDPAGLAQTIAELLAANLQVIDSDSGHDHYKFHHLDWVKLQSVYLESNVDYAGHYDGTNYIQRPAGLDFPEFPECTWLLKCDMPTAKFATVLEKLEPLRPSAVLVHQPVSRDDDWIVELRVAQPSWLQRWLPKPLAQWLQRWFGLRLWTDPQPVERDAAEDDDETEEHDCDGIFIEWPRSLGFTGLIRGVSSDDPTTNTYVLSGDHVSLRVVKGRVSTTYLGTEKFFGTAQRGDTIEVWDQDTVFVNGDERDAE